MQPRKPIHVLHVLNSAHGGSALSTFQLIEALADNAIASSLVCFNNATEEQKKKISSLVNGRVIFIPLYWTNKRVRVAAWKRPLLEVLSLWKTWKGYRYQRQLDRLITTNQINIIHTSTIVNREGAIAARRHNLPHLWHVRELIGPDSYYSFPNFKWWASSVERHSNFLIANSKATVENLSLYFSPGKIRYIPNGIDPSGYHPKVHAARNPLVVAMVGNVTSRLKNHEFFIKAAAQFRGDATVIFQIFGSMPSPDDAYYNGLKLLIGEYGLENQVFFMGHRQTERIMADIDVLFHPAGLESFGRIFIEAMAGGIPLLAADGGGAVELVRNDVNGFRVQANNTVQAANAINALRSVELRTTLGSNGRAIVESEYSLDLLENRIRTLYYEVLK